MSDRKLASPSPARSAPVAQPALREWEQHDLHLWDWRFHITHTVTAARDRRTQHQIDDQLDYDEDREFGGHG